MAAFEQQRLAQSYKQYKENKEEELKKEMDEVMEMLFGDESDTTDSLTYREGIVVPNKEWR